MHWKFHHQEIHLASIKTLRKKYIYTLTLDIIFDPFFQNFILKVQIFAEKVAFPPSPQELVNFHLIFLIKGLMSLLLLKK